MASPSELTTHFKALIRAGALAQSYVFFGEDDSALRQGARSLAAYLETGSWTVSEKALLDSQVVDGSLSGIDEVRDARRFLFELPFRSPRKTLLVERADQLTDAAQNTLLKVAEEPPSSALILCTARDPAGLIPPLASRLQKVFVSAGRARKTAERPARELARQALSARTARERREVIKAAVEDPERAHTFVRELIGTLAERPEQRTPLLSALLYRAMRMEQLSVNRRLQIEAAFAESEE